MWCADWCGVLTAVLTGVLAGVQVSGTDAPWRETANIKDGSNLTADMSVQVCQPHSQSGHLLNDRHLGSQSISQTANRLIPDNLRCL